MLQISTQDLQSLIPENQDEINASMKKEEGDFYKSIKAELDSEIREPHPSTIEKILAYSKAQTK